ncbi:enolase C-terminal domain-like protein [Actinosynnema sp. NPDC023794]
MFTHVGAVAPGPITALDSHWIWQDGQALTRTPLRIRDGGITVPTTPGLGVELDRDASPPRTSCTWNGLGARDGATAMRQLVPG